VIFFFACVLVPHYLTKRKKVNGIAHIYIYLYVICIHGKTSEITIRKDDIRTVT
jgi:hypothetical protein